MPDGWRRIVGIRGFVDPMAEYTSETSGQRHMEKVVMELIKKSPQTRIALAFVGIVVPDEPQYHSVAFARSGNMFQTNLLSSIASAGIPVSTVISPIPIQSWPSGDRLLVRGTKYRLKDGTQIVSLTFVNIPLLKQLTIGFATLQRLLVWGWRNRKSTSRVVCTFNLSVPPGLFTLMAARLIGAKAIALLNDINVPGETVPSSLLFKLDYALHRWLMPRFDGLVVVSEAIVRDFGLSSPHILIEGGIAESTFVTASQPTHSSHFVVVSAGRLDETNGFRVLLKAFSSLRGEHYRLRIAGAGPLEAEVRRAADQDSRIEYCGYLPFTDVLQLYESADVLVNMRLTQSINTKYFFPSKLIEYMASGRLVISTCTGHVEEEFGKFIFLLRQETAEGLAQAIQDVERLGKHDREQKGAITRDYVMATKTWNAQGHHMVRFIESLIGAEPVSPASF
jgi:glycosyltransferase involved in cell wall biosynthesis